MTEAKIKVSDDGPYEITGSVEIMDADGNKFKSSGEVSLCRCGHSGDKPFCDGTHEDIDFESAPRAEHLIEV